MLVPKNRVDTVHPLYSCPGAHLLALVFLGCRQEVFVAHLLQRDDTERWRRNVVLSVIRSHEVTAFPPRIPALGLRFHEIPAFLQLTQQNLQGEGFADVNGHSGSVQILGCDIDCIFGIYA